MRGRSRLTVVGLGLFLAGIIGLHFRISKGNHTLANVLGPNKVDLYPTHVLADDVTIVTAYFNIGEFMKSRKDHVVTTNTYLDWIKVFGRIENPVVAFFDDRNIYDLFLKLRQNFAERTRVFLVNREDLESFRLKDRIEKIFRTPGYPKYLPNTVVPEYSCIMHAKFELEHKVAQENYFKTKYISWLDIGYFRLDKENFTFGIDLPPDFNPTKVSYSQVGQFDNNKDAKTIVMDNLVWVCGGMNLARIDVMLNFTRDYARFMKYCLDSKFISTDQQVLYGMYTDGIPEAVKPSVSIQTHNEGSGEVYFRLGFISRNAWWDKHR